MHRACQAQGQPAARLNRRFALSSIDALIDMFFATVGQAVSSYLNAHAVQWLDWEDRPKGGRASVLPLA